MSTPEGVWRQRWRWARKASTLEGAAWRRAFNGSGFAFGAGAATEAAAEGTGSPVGRLVAGGAGSCDGSVDSDIAMSVSCGWC